MRLRISTFVMVLATALVIFPSYSTSSHIVFIQYMASYSHIVASKPLAEALLLRGHNITYISSVHYTSSAFNPNITFIVPSRLEKYNEAVIKTAFSISARLEGQMPNWMLLGEQLSIEACDVFLGSPEVIEWINSADIPKVDLIYVDSFPGPECIMGVAHKLGSKLAIFQPYTPNPKIYDSLGISIETSAIPTWAWILNRPFSFLDRVKNTLAPMGMRFSQLHYWGKLESLIKRKLDMSYLPSLDELYQSVSLVLNNGHFMDEQRRALPPLFVNVPALHVREKNDVLPKEILDFLDSKDENGTASEGFVYISFGTIAEAHKLPLYIRQCFLNAIKAFPQIRFLWRWSGPFPLEKPKNLYLSKWFNQQDVLAHPKIRGFVTQAGRPSTQEAVYHGVPLLAFPILGDQDYNANMLEELGVAINLEIGQLNDEKLKNALDSILNNRKIRDRWIEVSKLFRDLPMKPIDTAVWWTEYVLRNNNTSHLHSLAINQTWYERRCLDVWIFLAICISVFTIMLVLIGKFLYYSFFNNISVSEPNKKGYKLD